MATVTDRTPTRKAFRATLRDEAGTLAKVNGDILFFSDAGDITPVEPEDCVWLCVLGECGVAEAQQLADRRHGGAARIACARLQEVA
jgi:hypothetical protein